MYKERILIAEERLTLSARLADIVASAGYQPVLTQSGQVAVSRARMLRPSLVLLSERIGPPGASETARRLKESPETAKIPVVLLSAGFGPGITDGKAYPVEACLPVDINAGHLAHIVRFLLSEYAKHAIRSSNDVWPLEGTIDDGMLLDVLNFLFMSGRSGKIAVSNGAQLGALYFERSQIVHAELDDVTGEDAFFKTCFLEVGHFRFEPDLKPALATMRGEGRELLLEACRRLDTSRRLDDPVLADFSDWKPAWRHRAAEPQEVAALAPVPEPAPAEETWDPRLRARPVVVPRRLPRYVPYGAAAALVGLAFVGKMWLSPDPSPDVGENGPSWLLGSIPISVRSAPDGALLRIDGQNVGETPLTKLRLHAGTYVFQLSKDGLEPLQQRVILGAESEGSELFFELRPAAPPTGTLVFLVSPPGASVKVSGEEVRDQRQALTLPAGEHEIEVSAPGFEVFKETIEIQPGSSREVAIQLLRKRAPRSEPAVVETLPVFRGPVEPPVRIAGADAPYPEEAAKKKLQGLVEIALDVDEQGNVVAVRVEKSAGPILDGAVVAAAEKWKYRPASQGGVPVRHSVTYRQKFRRP